jgi:hypothetical protein
MIHLCLTWPSTVQPFQVAMICSTSCRSSACTCISINLLFVKGVPPTDMAPQRLSGVRAAWCVLGSALGEREVAAHTKWAP